MAKLNEERRARLADVLLEEKKRLWTEVRRELFDEVGGELQGQYDMPQDAGERSLLDLLEDTGMAIADVRRQQLTRMDQTLARLQEGSYGQCQDCGNEISLERLQAVPYATRCKDCQARQEGPRSGPRLTL